MNNQKKIPSVEDEMLRLKDNRASFGSDARMSIHDQQVLDNFVQKELANVRLLNLLPSSLIHDLANGSNQMAPSRND